MPVGYTRVGTFLRVTASKIFILEIHNKRGNISIKRGEKKRNAKKRKFIQLVCSSYNWRSFMCSACISKHMDDLMTDRIGSYVKRTRCVTSEDRNFLASGKACIFQVWKNFRFRILVNRQNVREN